jgi:hypothetical protein
MGTNEKEYFFTVTEQLEELIFIADEYLDECLNDVFLFRDKKDEFYEKYVHFGIGYEFVFKNNKTTDDRFIILLLDKIDEVLHKLYHIHLFIRINEEKVQWTDQIERDWRTLDYLKRRDLLSCKYGLQRILNNDYNIKNNDFGFEREIKWDSTFEKQKKTIEDNHLQGEADKPDDLGTIIKTSIEENDLQPGITQPDYVPPAPKGKGRPKEEDKFDLGAKVVAKIFYALSLAKAIPYNGHKTNLAALYAEVTGYNGENARNKNMNLTEGLEKEKKIEVIKRMKEAIKYIEALPE